MQTIIGIDEVGRGCWAGPLLVVAARTISPLPVNTADSKALTKAQRESVSKGLLLSCEFGEGWVEPAEIDAVGLSQAMRIGVDRALSALNAQPDDRIIMDGNSNYCADVYTNVECVIKADALHPIVSAASIHAKVRRDYYMSHLPAKYTMYGFEKHVGYGTKLHTEMLKSYGVSDIHRRSYKPIQVLLES